MFWVDETIKEVIKRQDKKYLLTDYKTPSGKIHVGSLRGVVIHDVIGRGLLEAKCQAEYWYGFDDFDPMDGLSEELKENFQKYMGLPLCNIPSPEPNFPNFARYFAHSFIETFKSIGVSAKIVWASELYRNGAYNKSIEIILNNAAEIRRIYKEISGGEKPADWYPFQVVCPKCGKIGTTRVFNWDGKQVSFICEGNLVKWATGCGYQGKISPFDGNGKMPYKVETAAKWFEFGTSVELAGKDHYTKGGTFNVAQVIAQNVFKIKPAFGYGYEWLLIGGKSMSTSKGIGNSVEEIASILPPELLRFLMVRTRAKRAIEFDINGDTIPLLYDEYDRCSLDFQKDPQPDTGRAFYFSEINPTKDMPSYRLRFSKIAYMLQMPRVEIIKYAEEEKGSKLTAVEVEEVKNRMRVAKGWLENYAPDNYKFTIQDTLPESAKKLSDQQKEFIGAISKIYQTRDSWTGEDLHKELHDLKKTLKIEPREAFGAIYQIFIGKDSGPQAGWLLASLDKNFVIERLIQSVK